MIKDLANSSRLRRLKFILGSTVSNYRRVKKAKGAINVHEITKNWAIAMTEATRLNIEVTGQPYTDEPCLYVSNHVSYLDIIVLMSLLPVTFIAKKELANWPIFGPAATAAGTVYIDRSSTRSVRNVANVMSDAILKQKKSIALFPEGTSGIRVNPWKKGAFSVARDHGFKVQAVRIIYNPLRPAAFIDDDALASSLWGVLALPKIDVSIEFFTPVTIKDAHKDGQKLEDAVRESFLAKLASFTAEDI